MFRDGEIVCFLGDSITHSRPFHGMILTYYLTRFPERTVRFVNAGVAGDNAGACRNRLHEDVIPKTPSTIVVMMGMNDVGRGNYVADPSNTQLAAQKQSLDGYRKNMDSLLHYLSEETSARFILLTPTPFDQTCINDNGNNQPGCNEGLGKCADIARELAPKYNAEVIDLHGPMTAFNLEQQQHDPRYTLIGPDRVHPGLPGNLMMAWLFLKAQDVPALVSELEFDTTTGAVTAIANATISEVRRTEKGWEFTVREGALPYPVDDELSDMLDKIPLTEGLNREILKINGLGPGLHDLFIDEIQIARHTATEWAAGVNLGSNRKTPQYRQAEKVAKLNEKRRATEGVLRDYACSRWYLRLRGVDPDDFDAIRQYAATQMPKTGYYEERIPTYLDKWQQRDTVAADVLRFGHLSSP